MTEGTSQGLFVVVAIVIFGIFVGLSYNLFGKTLQPAMVNMFETALKIDGGETPDIPIDPEVEVVLEDANLERAVREQLELTADEKITDKKMEEIKTFDLDSKNISSLKGLEYAKNLERIYILNNNITDLTPLTNLINLKYIHAMYNNITDLTPLTNLTNLEMLIIGGNDISDITPLKNMKKLRSLNLVNTKVTDFSPVKNLPNLTNLAK